MAKSVGFKKKKKKKKKKKIPKVRTENYKEADSVWRQSFYSE